MVGEKPQFPSQKVAELSSKGHERRLEREAGAALALPLANRASMRLGLADLYKADPSRLRSSLRTRGEMRGAMQGMPGHSGPWRGGQAGLRKAGSGCSCSRCFPLAVPAGEGGTGRLLPGQRSVRTGTGTGRQPPRLTRLLCQAQPWRRWPEAAAVGDRTRLGGREGLPVGLCGWLMASRGTQGEGFLRPPKAQGGGTLDASRAPSLHSSLEGSAPWRGWKESKATCRTHTCTSIFSKIIYTIRYNNRGIC